MGMFQCKYLIESFCLEMYGYKQVSNTSTGGYAALDLH